jgi:hypothetical protein
LLLAFLSTSIVGAHFPPAVLETSLRPKKAEVWVDGVLVGQSRDFDGRWDRLWLAPGEHVVEFRMKGYQTLRHAIELSPAGYTRIEDALQEGEGVDPRSTDVPAKERDTSPRHGRLQIEVLPADAVVYLDDEFLARGDELARLHGAIAVPVGVHLVQVVRPGYASKSIEIEVPTDEPIRLALELQADDERAD